MSSPGRHSGRGGRGSGRGPRRGRGRVSMNGRRFNRMDRIAILDLWTQLSSEGQQEMRQLVAGIGGGNIPPAEENLRQENAARQPGQPNQAPVRIRTRIWERNILRDIPQVQEFGQADRATRRTMTSVTRLMSIATGVVARGQRVGETDENIRQAILDNWGDTAAMHSLFQQQEPNPPEQLPAVAAVADAQETGADAVAQDGEDVAMGNQGDSSSNDEVVPQVPDAAAVGGGQPAGRQELNPPKSKKAYVVFKDSSSEDDLPDGAIGPENEPPPPEGGGASADGRDESRRRPRRNSGNKSSKKPKPK